MLLFIIVCGQRRGISGLVLLQSLLATLNGDEAVEGHLAAQGVDLVDDGET